MGRQSENYGDLANLRAVMDRLAPAAPPCFQARDQSVEFLIAAQLDHCSPRRRAPLDFRHGEPRFNRNFDFCADCTAKHALAMKNDDRCHPLFLLRIEVTTA